MLNWFKKKPNGPDFSNIDSREKAEELFKQGILGKLFLMPLEFGGQDIPPNFVFVPHFVIDLKRDIDFNIVKPLVAEGKARHYSAAPKYQGKSFIPSSILVSASEPGSFSSTIAIWGDALKGE